jgi:hypothetical protein
MISDLQFFLFFIRDLLKKGWACIRRQTLADWAVHILLISFMFYMAFKNIKRQDYMETYGRFTVGKCLVIDYMPLPIVYREGYVITVRVGIETFANIDLQKESKQSLRDAVIVGQEYDEYIRTMYLTSEKVPLSFFDEDEKETK